MLRGVIAALVLLWLSAMLVCARDNPATQPATDPAPPEVPAQVQELTGRVVRIYYDVDLLGTGKPSSLDTQYLAIVMEDSGVTVQRQWGLQENPGARQPDVVIFGEMEEPKFSNEELADPFVVNLMKRKREELARYKEAKPKLEEDATTAGARVIKFEDVGKVLGVRATKAQMLEALDARAEKLLKRGIADFDGKGMSMSDIIDFLRDVSEANIFVNWRALEAAGVDRKAPLNLNIEHKTLAEALDALLKATAGDGPELAYWVDEGVITISTEKELKSKEGKVKRN